MRARKKLDFGVSDNDKNINIYRIYGLLITVSSTHSTQIVWQRNNMGSNSNHIDLISSLADQWSATTIGFYEQIFLLLFFFFVVDLRSEDVAVLWQSTWSRTGAICWEIWIVWTCRSIWYPQGLSSTIRLNELQQFMLSIVHLVEKKCVLSIANQKSRYEFIEQTIATSTLWEIIIFWNSFKMT